MKQTVLAFSTLSVVLAWCGCGAGAAPSQVPNQNDAAPPTDRDGSTVPDGSRDGDRRATDSSANDAGPSIDSGGQPPTDGPLGWRLTWSDEFDGVAAAAPDASKWGYDVGGNGWGNNELEFYTSRRENSSLDGLGHLVISTLRETYMGRSYTSARLLTKGKFQQMYGRFETRAKIPSGRGLWPAFWALGANIAQVSWPACGEIDIMENVGREPGINHGTLHGPGYSGGAGLSGRYALAGGAALSADFHTFAVEWEQNVVRFYVDDHLYETRTSTDVPGGSRWVYDHPFFLILNVAVGGPFPGPPDATTVLPQTMTVDYVRVYSR
jgi:beta-glucanase (GH16 family)